MFKQKQPIQFGDDTSDTSNIRQAQAQCSSCGGSGTSSFACQDCQGTGIRNGQKCFFCRGLKFTPCPACNGRGSR